MATEFKLSYTGNQINEKLKKIDNLADKSELPTKTSDLTNDSGFLTSYTETDPTVPAWAKEPAKPTYTASEVGADVSGTASNLVSAHNTASNTHSDIREQISQLSTDKADKSAMTLGVHTDGFVYLFINGTPQGNGLDIKADVVEGDVFGYVDENNVIVLNGALAEGIYTIKYEMDDGSTVEIGNLVLDNNVYYSVTNNLTNCTNSNNTVQMVEGGSYSATISAKSGYELKSIVVKMGGTDISSTAVSGGKITIANVTGNIVIMAVAEEVKAAEIVNQIPLSIDTDGTVYNGIGYKTGVRIKGDGSVTSGTGISTTGFIPVSVGDTVYMKGLTFEDTSYTRLVHYDSNKSYVTVEPKMTFPTTDWTNEGNGVYSYTIVNESASYIRIASKHIMDGTEIVTINQPIV